jgi:hypothetical protein
VLDNSTFSFGQKIMSHLVLIICVKADYLKILVIKQSD